MTAAPLHKRVHSGRPPPVIGCDEVHVCQAELDQPPSQVQSFFDTLAADERARAGRFYFAEDRARYIAARGMLRAILGRYLQRAPESLTFFYGARGKPALSAETGGDAIRFNVSHSHGVAFYAVARGREVGIDLERIRCDVAVAEIAERFFSRREAAILRTLPSEAQHQAFFHCWTRKEAYIKAHGEGLSLPLDQFDVSLAPGDPAAILGTRPDPSEASRWSLQDLSAAPGYVAALAAEGHDWRLAYSQWPDYSPQPV